MGRSSNAAERPRVLLVEDESPVRRLVERWLAIEGCETVSATSVAEALARLQVGDFDLLISDVGLPGASGMVLLAHVKAEHPLTPVVLITGSTAPEMVVEALHERADRYLLKPFEAQDLARELRAGLARRSELLRAAGERAGLEQRLREQEQEVRSLVLRGARSLVEAVEAKDAYTRGHSVRVMEYTSVLAETVGGFDIDRLRLGAELHDIGKIGVPDVVLNKRDRLTEMDYGQIRRHPMMGRRILEPLIDNEEILSMTLLHHERWDGRGYPVGLAGNDIPEAARVLAVADALDAMTSHRAYRDARRWDFAVGEIRANRGRQFAPAAVDVFESALPRLTQAFHALHTDA